MAKKKIPAAIRRLVAERAGHRCEYCKTPSNYAPGNFHDDHITPESKGGASTPDNLARTCDGCNNGKADKTEAVDPATGAVVLLFHPRKDKWEAHFAWSDNFLFMTGLTPTGRATIEALRLNRLPLVNLRSALLLAGVHPPVN